MNRMNQKIFRRFSLLLTVMTIFTSIPFQAFAAVDVKETEDEQPVATRTIVEINTIEDLLALGDDCKNQTYSTDKAFVLGSDFDLTDHPNFCIPFMDGDFNGKGHTIKGLDLSDENSDYAFIRYVGVNGVVEKLTVEATVDGGNDQEDIAIVVGSNAGIIRDCTAEGTVVGQTIIGSIAGFNDKTGVIKDCENRAKIDGKYETGGIVGKNLGTVRDCTNKGAVNTSTRINKKTPDGDGGINISLTNAAVGVAADDRANETGGIAGHSEGSILYCLNQGNVGSDQLGISTGGIVGWTKGEVTGSDNEAVIRGRSSVGGIVGYMEPRESTEYDRDYVDELSHQVDDMSDALDALKNAGETLGDDLYANTNVLEDQIRDLKNVVRNYVDEYDRIGDDARGGLRPQVDQIRSTVDDMNYKFHLKKIAKDIRNIQADIKAMDEILAKLKKLITALNGEEPSGGSGDVSEEIEQYKEAISQLKKEEASLLKEVKQYCGDDEFEQYYQDAKADENRVGTSLSDLDPMTKYQLSLMLDALNAYRTDAISNLDDILDITDKYPDKFKAIRNDLRNVKDHLEAADDVLRSTVDRIDATTGQMKVDVRPRVDNISNSFETTADRLKYDFDRVIDAMDTVSDRASDIRTLTEDGYDELKERIDEKTVYVDASEFMSDSAGEGKVVGCENRGEVYGTSESGGIVGTLNKEAKADVKVYLFNKVRNENNDDEEDDDEDDEKKDSLTHHLQALLYQNINLGDVYVDGDYAGGIAGRALFGRITECENYGDIVGDESRYVGGIAGRSKHTVERCYALNGVCGTSYVGGIVGRGKDLVENISCSYMDMDEAYVKSGGAIAGKADGSVSANQFVDNGFGAVDGVTRVGEAVGMSYQQLLSGNTLPKNFKQFTIRFIDEDKVLWSSDFSYGAEFKESQYPILDQRTGEYARWEEKQLSPVCRNVTIHSIRRVFFPSVSGCIGEGPETMILGGDFYPDSELAVEAVSKEDADKIKAVKQQVDSDIHYVYSSAYRYNLTQDEAYSMDKDLRIRSTSLLANSILVLDENMNPVGTIQAANKVKTYLTMKTAVPQSGYIVVIDHVSNKVMVGGVVGGIAALIILLIALFFLRKSRKAVVKKIKTQMEEIKSEENYVEDEDYDEDEDGEPSDEEDDEHYEESVEESGEDFLEDDDVEIL